ncbi:MAG: TolC family protein, partial [Candidatus Omnitrophota bacterium]
MLKKSLIIQLFIFVINIPIAFAGTQEQKSNNDLRQNEMEKSIFMLSGAQTRVLKIGLIDCMLYALKKNSDILIKRIDPKLKANDQRVAEADFEPAFNTDFTYSDNTVLASSRLQGADVYNTHDINLNANIAGKIVTGTQYKFDFLNQRYKSDSSYQIYNPYYDIEPKITLTQPLLRGFGILVNRADIIIAQNNMQESEKSFKDTVIATISSAKSAYYNYIFALENYKIDKLALERVY